MPVASHAVNSDALRRPTVKARMTQNPRQVVASELNALIATRGLHFEGRKPVAEVSLSCFVCSVVVAPRRSLDARARSCKRARLELRGGALGREWLDGRAPMEPPARRARQREFVTSRHLSLSQRELVGTVGTFHETQGKGWGSSIPEGSAEHLDQRKQRRNVATSSLLL